MGSSFLPSEITAAFLYAQLENIDTIQSHIQELETKYDKQFEDIFEAIQFLITDHEKAESKTERVKIGYKK